MPGYETERFVGLSQDDKAELTCSICQDILCKPLVAQCCQQSFCGDCINDWLKNNNTCPYDRKTLNSTGLTRPSRIMLNVLNKLKINCDYKKNGCKETLLLENLSQHIINCRYNVEICKKCFCEIQDKSTHDCIKTLLELNRKRNEEIETLKRNASAKTVKSDVGRLVAQLNRQFSSSSLREESALIRENRELKEEKENFLKTIEELSNNSDQQISQNRNCFISEELIMKQARRHLLTPEVLIIDMSEDIKNKILSTIKEEILKEYTTCFNFCKNIKEKLDAEFGSNWHCSVSHQKVTNCFYSYEEGNSIKIKFGELYLEIYKTKYEFVQRIRNGKIKREIEIIETKMDEKMISDVKKITFEAIEKSNTFQEVSKEMRTQMEKINQGKWLCFIFAHFGKFSMITQRESYIWFNVDNLELTLFKAFT